MAQQYKQLDLEERELIAIMKAQGITKRQIAGHLNRSPSTISRELKRNAPPIHENRYLGHKAQERAELRKQRAAKRDRLKNPNLRGYVWQKLELGWSPEQIAARWNQELRGSSVSHEAIYQYIYAERRDLIPYLARAHKTRHSKGKIRKGKRVLIPNRISIEQRTKAAEQRDEFGHWESDSIVSKQSKAALNVVVERRSRVVHISPLAGKLATLTRDVIIQCIGAYPKSWRRSISYDNGTENIAHEAVNEALQCRSYFCAPYRSWEKGTVENTIGLIRRFLPKKTDFAKISFDQLKLIEDLLNNRPRKCLGFKTPYEVVQLQGVALPG